MATMKYCKKCGEYKDYSQFSKKTKSKDGLQCHCKDCNKVENHKFRTEINPEHHAKWQRDNWDHFAEYYANWRRGDKAGKIYAIISPDNFVYVGMTQTQLSVRMIEHRVKYRRFLNGKLKKSIHPLLFESFDKYGIENHQVKVLFEDQYIDRKGLKQMETSFIQAFKQKGNSLNIRK